MFISTKIRFSSLLFLLFSTSADGKQEKETQETYDTNYCGSLAKRQSDYDGTTAFTKSGYLCQDWTSQSPHKHTRTVSNYPNKGLGAHNFCRNPDDGPEAWCFTTEDEVRWEACDIKNCETKWDWRSMHDAKKKLREELESAKREINRYFDDVKNLDVLCQMYATDFQINPCEKDFLPGKRRDNRNGFESGDESTDKTLQGDVPEEKSEHMWGSIRKGRNNRNERVMPKSSDEDNKENICRVQISNLPSTADSLFQKTVRVLIADPDYNEAAYKKSFEAINHFNYCTQNMLAFKMMSYVLSVDLTGLNWKDATFEILQAARKEDISIKNNKQIKDVNKIDTHFNMAELVTMVVLPDNIDMDGAYGFAILHNGLVVIKAEQAKQPSAVLHEIGHSLGMRHSSSPNGGTYGDNSCIMGAPKNNMVCFNGAKSTYLGLYREYTIVINPVEDQCDIVLTIVDVHAHLMRKENLFNVWGTYGVIIIIPDHDGTRSLHLMYYNEEKKIVATVGTIQTVKTDTNLQEVKIATDSERVFDLLMEHTKEYNGVLYKLCPTNDDNVARVMVTHDVLAEPECPSKFPPRTEGIMTLAPTLSPTPFPYEKITEDNIIDAYDMWFSNKRKYAEIIFGPISEWDVPRPITDDNKIDALDMWNSDKRKYAEMLYGPISEWDVSRTTMVPITDDNKYDARDMWFSDERKARSIYGPISKWDVLRVTSFYQFFHNKHQFNENISWWNVERVTNMAGMFEGAHAFNQDLSGWNVYSVNNMWAMFYKVYEFNQDLSRWNVDRVTKMRSMFYDNYKFNQDLSGWNVERVTNMEYMFQNAKAFNQDLSGWNVGRVNNMYCMFKQARSFNQDLSRWNIQSVTDMDNMFYQANAFHQKLCWNIPSNCKTWFMFYESPGNIGC